MRKFELLLKQIRRTLFLLSLILRAIRGTTLIASYLLYLLFREKKRRK